MTEAQQQEIDQYLAAFEKTYYSLVALGVERETATFLADKVARMVAGLD